MTYQQIETLIKSRRYDEALKACDEASSHDTVILPEICRLRSWIFTSQGKYDLGISELDSIIKTDRAELRDFHSAAFWSLYDKNFVQSKKWFEVVLARGEEENDKWFESSALFYLAYISLELEHYEMARDHLTRSGKIGDESTVFIPIIGAITRKELLKEIDKRANAA